MAALLDTNVLVYAFDPRDPAKQRVAARILEDTVLGGEICIPHQALVEFLSAVTKPAKPSKDPLLSLADACKEVEEFTISCPILYPDVSLVQMALRGVTYYRLRWFDAHLLAYAERYGLDILYSEDFQDGRIYGAVRVVNPFRAK